MRESNNNSSSNGSKKPNTVLKAWPLRLSIWESITYDDNQNERRWYSCKLEKSYKKDGQYHTTSSLSGDDLVKAAALLQEAYNITQIEIQRS